MHTQHKWEVAEDGYGYCMVEKTCPVAPLKPSEITAMLNQPENIIKALFQELNSRPHHTEHLLREEFSYTHPTLIQALFRHLIRPACEEMVKFGGDPRYQGAKIFAREALAATEDVR